jgi:DNA-directed RNA polymerase subunit RPC12/RpoP
MTVVLKGRGLNYKCPICGHQFDAAALKRPTGITGASYCPNCDGRVRIFLPYARFVAAFSFLIALSILRILHVRTILAYMVDSILIWIPVSLFLNALSTRYKPAVLKKLIPRAPRRRTFFEWLYERDQIRAPEMFDKDKKDS